MSMYLVNNKHNDAHQEQVNGLLTSFFTNWITHSWNKNHSENSYCNLWMYILSLRELHFFGYSALSVVPDIKLPPDVIDWCLMSKMYYTLYVSTMLHINS